MYQCTRQVVHKKCFPNSIPCIFPRNAAYEAVWLYILALTIQYIPEKIQPIELLTIPVPAAMSNSLDPEHLDRGYRYRKHFSHVISVDVSSPANSDQLLRHEFSRGRLACETVRNATRCCFVPIK